MVISKLEKEYAYDSVLPIIVEMINNEKSINKPNSAITVGIEGLSQSGKDKTCKIFR